MIDPSPEPYSTCPDCGAPLAGAGVPCGRCQGAEASQESLSTASEPPTTPFAEGWTPPSPPHPVPLPDAPQHAGFHFSLASLMLFVTLVAVIMGVASVAPGLAIALAVLAVPALVHTAVLAMRRRARGEPLSPADKLSLFLSSAGALLISLLAAGIAFYATCWVGFFAGAGVGAGVGVRGYDSIGWGLMTGVIAGVLAGIVVAVLLIRAFLLMFSRPSLGGKDKP
jgi:hypothetical protein